MMKSKSLKAKLPTPKHSQIVRKKQRLLMKNKNLLRQRILVLQMPRGQRHRGRSLKIRVDPKKRQNLSLKTSLQSSQKLTLSLQ